MEVAHSAQVAVSPQLRLPVLEACSETYDRALRQEELQLAGLAKGALIRVYEADLEALRRREGSREGTVTASREAPPEA